MVKKIKNLLVAIICLSAMPFAIANNSINSVSITSDTWEALSNCLHYRIVGACFWLVCDVGCRIEMTPKIDHYLPDLVDTVYPKNGSDPWPVVNNTIDKMGHFTGSKIFHFTDGYSMSNGNANSTGNHDSNIKLREVDVIGNPALFTLHFRYLLKGQATPLLPYFQSQLDASEWRSGLLEQLYPQSWAPGVDDVGTFLTNNWGAVYPRSGFIMQDNLGKASAVLAVRAGNIATTASFDHIHKNLNKAACPDKACTTAGPILSKTQKIEWQMLLPNKATTCTDRIDSSANPIWTKSQPSNQSYSWIVWREYRGCVKDNGFYLGSVG